MNDESYDLTRDASQMNIYLNIGYIDKVLPFLLGNQIAFTLSGAEAQQSWSKAPLSELGPIEGGYDKYIVEGVEKNTPENGGDCRGNWVKYCPVQEGL